MCGVPRVTSRPSRSHPSGARARARRPLREQVALAVAGPSAGHFAPPGVSGYVGITISSDGS